jgi:hypothetical protein
MWSDQGFSSVQFRQEGIWTQASTPHGQFWTAKNTANITDIEILYHSSASAITRTLFICEAQADSTDCITNAVHSQSVTTIP